MAAALSLVIFGQERLAVRSGPFDYHAQVSISQGFTIAAEFVGRTVSAPQKPFVLKDYVVVEVALFVADFNFATERFSLQMNGKTPLLAQSPGMVGASLKYPDWENQRQITATAGVGDANVILGRPTPTPRFPDDRRGPTRPPGTPAKPSVDSDDAPWDWAAKLAWNDGPGRGPAAGLLYFPYNGNLAKLKTIDLIYNGPTGLVTLHLRESEVSPAKSKEPTRRP